MIRIPCPTDLLRTGDLTCMSLAELIDLAARMKADPDGWGKALAGQSLDCVFAGPAITHPARTSCGRAGRDLDTLRGHGLPAERVTLTGDDPATDLRALSERLRRLL